MGTVRRHHPPPGSPAPGRGRKVAGAGRAASGIFRTGLIIVAVTLCTAPAVAILTDFHWRTGLDGWKVAHLVIFAMLYGLLAFGAVNAGFGFIIRCRGGDRRVLSAADLPEPGPIDAPTAIVMPVYHEEVARVMAGVRAIHESVRADGRLRHCDFHILSDSTEPGPWLAEEAAWAELVRATEGGGRIFYRKRRENTGRKAGNIEDFCRQWGGRYRYMVVLDADSLMTGPAITRLVGLMERSPRTGLIQTVPHLVNGETVFARLLQFASRLYGPVFLAGVNFWQRDGANYWGHNAIIRLAPFMAHCTLPVLPGRPPFGGRILSHDYVEAALMRRAGWQVWLVTDLEGSYEECPANLIDFAQRDRRWLQGNLQHAALLNLPGLRPVSRLHFALGLLSYLSSPLWLAFLLLSMYIIARFAETGLTPVPADSYGTFLPWSIVTEARCLLLITLGLLFLPKLLALLDLRRHFGGAGAFGGWRRVAAGVGLETVLFTLLAPLLMLFHSLFAVLILFRRAVDWQAQRRGRAGTARLAECLRVHSGHMVIGLAWTATAWLIDPVLAWWLSPILIANVASAPLTYLTGSLAVGAWVKRRGLLTTPEETDPPVEGPRLEHWWRTAEAGVTDPDDAWAQLLLDPELNQWHGALLAGWPDAPADPAVAERLLREGPAALNRAEKLALLADAGAIRAMHQAMWHRPPEQLAAAWVEARDSYARGKPRHETPRAAWGNPPRDFPLSLLPCAPDGVNSPAA